MGRRSPGRSGGRGAPTPGACGRGRWKIGCPGIGRPGAGRIPMGTPGCTGGGVTTRGGGALYTGRGPVCGTIMRGAGGPGLTTGGGATGVAETGGVCAGEAGAVGEADATTAGVAGACGVVTAAGGTTMRGATMVGAAGAVTTGRSPAGVDGTMVGRAAWGAIGGAVVGAAGLTTGGATAGFATIDGAAGGRAGVGGATASFFCVIALSTSPGREMLDRSILVLISSSPRSGRADLAAGDAASDNPRRRTRTFSASKSSSELEWVFFSVTPTSCRTSRIALLFTSSSLARSLIRTLLIRPFLYSACARSSS
jgi:hypothetical protein